MAKTCHLQISQISGEKQKEEKTEILIQRFFIVSLVSHSVLMLLPSSVAVLDGRHLHLITADLADL